MPHELKEIDGEGRSETAQILLGTAVVGRNRCESMRVDLKQETLPVTIIPSVGSKHTTDRNFTGPMSLQKQLSVGETELYLSIWAGKGFS